MRNRYTGALAVAGVLALTVLPTAQGSGAQNNQAQNNQARDAAPRSPWKYYPMDRSVGDGGPAPKRDLTGTWAGPSSGANVPRSIVAAETPRAPSMTQLGQELYARNKPIGRFSP